VTTLDDVKGRAVITMAKAAEVLGITRGLAYKWAKAGELPVVRLGGRVFVVAPKLLELLGIEGGQ
jgi:excisionase family DNA binding protein